MFLFGDEPDENTADRLDPDRLRGLPELLQRSVEQAAHEPGSGRGGDQDGFLRGPLLAEFRSRRAQRPIGVHDQTLHEALEHGSYGIEIGRRGEDVAIGGFDLVDQGLHAVMLDADARRLPGQLGAFAAVATELDGIVAQIHDIDPGAVAACAAAATA